MNFRVSNITTNILTDPSLARSLNINEIDVSLIINDNNRSISEQVISLII